MNDPLALLSQRVIAAKQARLAVRDRVARTVNRLSPARLGQDAVEAAENLASETGKQIRRHPFTAAGALAGLIVIALHKPLGKMTAALLNEWLPQGAPDVDPVMEPVSDSDRSSMDGHMNSPSPTEHDT
jgi:hypothetical protein